MGVFTSSSDDEFDKFDIVVLSTLTLSRTAAGWGREGPSVRARYAQRQSTRRSAKQKRACCECSGHPWPEIDFLRR